MTISEQLREAALYAKEPAFEMPWSALSCSMDFEDCFAPKEHYTSTKGRTFLLIVAEALE